MEGPPGPKPLGTGLVPLSGEVESELRALLKLERCANDVERREKENQQAQEQTQRAEARNEIGIYVYALPHYLRYLFDQNGGRILLKVSRSDSDAVVRFRTQTRTTALPEQSILLRIYSTAGAATAPVEAREEQNYG